jgi:signal transduction histidine kinase
MQRRQFLLLFTGTAVGSPRAPRAQQENAVRTVDEVWDMRRQLADARQQTMQLLSMISEMRKPLAIVLGYTSLMLGNAYGDPPDEMRVALRRIEYGGEYATALINAVFDRPKEDGARIDSTSRYYEDRVSVSS